jgi:opacity protein-like surface antigen
MKAIVIALALGAPAVALAQPGADPSAPAPDPSPAIDPSAPPLAPVAPQAGPSATPPIPLFAPIEPPRDGFEAHHGVTFEANLGVGFVHVSSVGLSSDSENGRAAPAGLELAVGGWLTRRLALTFRISGVDVRADDLASGYLINGFYGPAVQYWFSPNVWVGGGVGFALWGTTGNDCETPSGSCTVRGWGFDLRAGYTFMQSHRQSLNVSAEITPEHYNADGGSWTATGFGVLFGYQYL